MSDTEEHLFGSNDGERDSLRKKAQRFSLRLSNLTGKSEVHHSHHHGKKVRDGAEVLKSIGPISPAASITEELYQRFVVFQRDEKGYGLTVSGDNPVFVQSVKEDGPAYAAGIQKGDRIIKVNGTIVTQSNHTEVVRLVKSNPFVALTLLGKSPVIKASQMAQNNSSPAPGLITAPQPAALDKQQLFSENRLQTFNIMREKEMRNIAQLNQAYAENPSEKIWGDLQAALTRVKQLQEQMLAIAALARGDSVDQGSKSFAERPLPPIPTDEAGKPTPPTRFSRKNSVGPNHTRQHSTPESLPSSGNLLSCPPESGNLNRSFSDLPTSPVDNYSGDLTSILSPTRKVHDPRMRTASVGDKVLLGSSPDKPIPPPPPYPPYSLTNGPANRSYSGSFPNLPFATRPQQFDVMTMEDDSLAAFSINQRPFLQYSELQRNLPHLSVFMLYLFNNAEPCSLLFHLLTEYFPKGNIKDMQRWAYELHSMFTMVGSPLELDFVRKVPAISSAIEDVMAKTDAKEDQVKNIFVNARIRALDVVKDQLTKFQQIRTAGLGTMYGPPDEVLDDALSSQEKTRDIVAACLGKKLEDLTDYVAEDPDNRLDKQAAVGTALATFLKINRDKIREGLAVIDKWPLILQKEKNMFKPKEKLRKLTSTAGHQFLATSPSFPSYCHQCSLLLWGASPQGFECSHCNFVTHRPCLRHLDKACTGKVAARSSLQFPTINNFMRKKSNQNAPAIAAAKRQHDDKEEVHAPYDSNADVTDAERKPPVSHLIDRFSRDSPATPETSESSQAGSFRNSQVSRSESLNTQRKRAKSGNRKKSDPLHLDRDGNDEEGRSLNASESSSASSHSLHAGDSPRESTEDVTESDFDFDPDKIPDWTADVPPELLNELDESERKRQEVLAELFHTERTHVRNLKVLYQVFYMPLYRDNNLLPQNVIKAIFANLEQMKNLHNDFNRAMRRMRKSSPVIGRVGDLLLSRFAGAELKQFKMEAAAFCQDQQQGMEELKNRQKNDAKLAQFLQEREKDSRCRRLQLKDLIPTEMQRLTKYPLLFERLLKYTKKDDAEGKSESQKIETVLVNCKKVLEFVNEAVAEKSNESRLKEIQDQIDMAPFKKTLAKLKLHDKIFELPRHKLLYDGTLTWRTIKQKSIDFRILVLEKQVVLVTKQDDKLLLKFHSDPAMGLDKKALNVDMNRYWSPILVLDSVFLRDHATDKNAFYLGGKGEIGEKIQMYELVASTANEVQRWKKNVQSAKDSLTRLCEPIPETFPQTATAVIAAESPEDIGSPTVPSVEGNDLTDVAEGGENVDGKENVPPPVSTPSDERRQKKNSNLNSPSAVIATTFDVFDAEIVRTPLEQLQRCDRKLEEALTDKIRLNSLILGMAQTALPHPDISAQPGSDPRRLLAIASEQVSAIASYVNEATALHSQQNLMRQRYNSMSSSSHGGKRDSCNQTEILPPVIPAHKLENNLLILNKSLSSLMVVVCQQDTENKQLRNDLIHTKEQIQKLRMEARSPFNSRPSSFMSVSSTGSSFPPDSLEGDSDHTTISDEFHQSIPVPANGLRQLYPPNYNSNR